MASLGPNSPGTVADDNAVGTVTWNDPNNAKASDDSRAYASVPSGTALSHYLKATNFGFSIPGGATINGILVEIERKRADDGGTLDSIVKIVKSDGTIGTTNKASETIWSTTEGYFSYGAVDDLWDETWTAEDINNANFGVVLSANIKWGAIPNYGAAYVDHIRITVYYTEGVGTVVKDLIQSGIVVFPR